MAEFTRMINHNQIILPTPSKSATAGAPGPGGKAISPADVHAMLDELALLIQYCCLYSKYLRQLTAGAESRVRQSAEGGGSSGTHASSSSLATPTPTPASVFAGPGEFDKMVDELINKYYMEGERWLMHQGARSAFPKSPDEEAAGLDECFFVLQRCGQRAIATNNVHAACAVLHFVSDLLSSQLLTKASDLLTLSAVKATAVVQEHMMRYKGADSATAGASLSKGLKSAISLASSIAGGGAASAESDDGDGADDPWGIAKFMEVFNLVERCVRYTERLGRDISNAGEAVFGGGEGKGRGRSSSVGGSNSGSSSGGAGGKTSSSPNPNPPGGKTSSSSTEMDKIRLCREDFEAAKVSFSQVTHRKIYTYTSTHHCGPAQACVILFNSRP